MDCIKLSCPSLINALNKIFGHVHFVVVRESLYFRTIGSNAQMDTLHRTRLIVLREKQRIEAYLCLAPGLNPKWLNNC